MFPQMSFELEASHSPLCRIFFPIKRILPSICRIFESLSRLHKENRIADILQTSQKRMGNNLCKFLMDKLTKYTPQLQCASSYYYCRRGSSLRSEHMSCTEDYTAGMWGSFLLRKSTRNDRRMEDRLQYTLIHKGKTLPCIFGRREDQNIFSTLPRTKSKPAAHNHFHSFENFGGRSSIVKGTGSRTLRFLSTKM